MKQPILVLTDKYQHQSVSQSVLALGPSVTQD